MWGWPRALVPEPPEGEEFAEFWDVVRTWPAEFARRDAPVDWLLSRRRDDLRRASRR